MKDIEKDENSIQPEEVEKSELVQGSRAQPAAEDGGEVAESVQAEEPVREDEAEQESEPKKSVPARALGQVGYFVVQTVRSHTKREYSELLARGLRSTKGENRAYPWAYFRLFAMLFILYAVFLLLIRFTDNELFAPAVTAIAAVMFNLPFLCLMFELYPNRDLSFIHIIFILLIGGTAACVISQIMYSLFSAPNAWLSAVYAGFFEELAKAAVTIFAIAFSSKRSPLAGFLVGAAVGCGFSIFEDMGYIFVLSNELPAMNLTTIISVSISRGFTAFCTHTLWTAFVGWAYAHFKRHLYNILNYVVLAFVCGLHICWDLPLSYTGQILVGAGCIVVAAVAAITIIAVERIKVFRAAGIKKPTQNFYLQDESVLDKRNYVYWHHWGRFTLALGAFLMAVVAVIYCSIPFRETYGTERFSNPEEFVLFMQNDLVLNFENNRPYNSHDTADDVTTTEGGELIAVTQKVVFDDINYYYRYNVIYDAVDDVNHYMLYQITVELESNEGALIKYFKEDLYNKGVLYASYFRINADVTGFNFESNGDVTVFIYDANFVRNLSDPRYMMLFGTFAGVFGASLICYGALEIKARRIKKLCSTTTASSAE